MLTLEDKQLIADNMEVVNAMYKLMETCMVRHVEKLVALAVDEPHADRTLLLSKARIDGMKMLVSDLKSTVVKNNKS